MTNNSNEAVAVANAAEQTLKASPGRPPRGPSPSREVLQTRVVEQLWETVGASLDNESSMEACLRSLVGVVAEGLFAFDNSARAVIASLDEPLPRADVQVRRLDLQLRSAKVIDRLARTQRALAKSKGSPTGGGGS